VKIIPIARDVWLEKYSDDAYITVFGEEPTITKESLFDAAFLVIDEEKDTPIVYMTMKQISTKGVFIEHGGSFPEFRGSPKVRPAFRYLLDYLHSAGSRTISLITRNTNTAMQKLALATGFICTGCNYNGEGLFLEYTLKFNEGDK